jgi:signal transduction histidine kinase
MNPTTLSLIFIVALLGIFCIALVLRLAILKRNIRGITGELTRTRDKDYNRQLQPILNDPTINRMVAELNRNLSYQQELKLREEEARKQLEQSVADIAHDLRTPLTVVKGNLQLLENEPLSPEGRQYLEVSRRKSESLKSMVDAFFELSVLESDTSQPALKPLDLTAFTAQCIIDHETLIRDKGLTPEIELPEKSVFVQANEELLARVLTNLLTNLCKYARESFRVTLNADTSELTFRNRIDHTDEIDIDHIFDRSYRADKARREGSAGLGLYIAKLLMEKQKGSITASIVEGEIIFALRFA